VAGSGLYYARGEEALAGFVRALSVPVVVPIWDRGSIPRPLEEFMGVLGAASGGPRLLPDADLILMAGAACDYRVGYLQPPAIREDARILRIDADPVRLHQGVGAHLPIPGDPRLVMEQISRACQGMPPKAGWLKAAIVRRDEFRRQRLNARPAGGGLHALDLMRGVQSVLTDETVVLIDGGNIGQWAHQVLCDRYPGHWLTCGASGVVGYGLPGAMAARLLYPDRPVLLISGDGALTFTVAEFETASRQGLGFAVLLADDQAWGITLTGHQKRYGQGITSELGPVRFDRMAEAFGAHGVRVERPEEVAPALRRGLAADRPTLIHAPVVRSSPAD
jgi:acetolactate synthase-1/2/3 large subunit